LKYFAYQSLNKLSFDFDESTLHNIDQTADVTIGRYRTAMSFDSSSGLYSLELPGDQVGRLRGFFTRL
jgi:hypothetical protein